MNFTCAQSFQFDFSQVNGLLETLSGLSTMTIMIAAGIHVMAFFILSSWARRDLRTIASTLQDFTRGLRQSSILDPSVALSDQIDAFLADVDDVIADPKRETDRQSLLQRIEIIDEKRRYLQGLTFETCYNIARTMIEGYPLAGVLGTLLAMGAALQTAQAAQEVVGVSSIVSRFGDAIWSTFAGLAATLGLMLINSLLEPRFTRLAENRKNVRETVAKAKRVLSLSTPDPETPQPATATVSVTETITQGKSS